MAIDTPSRLVEPPSRVEFNKFKFHQLKRLLLVSNEEVVPQEAINLIAVSSKYGLVFVGLEGGFKVIKLENVLDLDESLRQKNIAATDFPYQKVPSPTPCMIAISADDMTLAVCVSRNSCAVADMYDIRAFADQDEPPVPFTNVQLSSTVNVSLNDFVWNPVAVEMYAFCLSDGSLHVHELAETNLKIVGNLPSVGANAVCWSPKGKQIVVGKKNGSFSQHKPTLEEAKRFAAPSISENEISVISIMWLSTTLFAVVYAPSGNTDDKTPSLVFVSAQKGAEVTYTDYGDVCFGTDNSREPKYTMQYIPEWGVLICASSNSTETAVMGFNKNNNNVWEQWILDDSGRAELPLVNKVDSFPLGMGIIYCAQRKIVISDTETYSAMPIFFLLATTSLLCPFHMLYTVPGASPLVYPSEAISRDGERKRKGSMKQQQPTEIPKAANASLTSNTLKHSLQHSSSPQANNLFSPPTPTQEAKISSFAAPLPAGQNTALNQMRTLVKPEVNSAVPFQYYHTFASTYCAAEIANGKNVLPRKTPSAPAQFQNFPTQSATFSVSSPGQTVQPVAGVNTSYYAVSTTSQVPSSQVFSFSASSGEVETTSVITSPHPSQSSPAPINVALSASVPVPAGQMQSEHGKKNEVNSASNSTYMATLLDEIAEFEKELCNLKEKSTKRTVEIGTKDEMAYLKQTSVHLSDFQKNMKDTMQSLNTEIHSLKNFSLETYAAISEADSREKRIKDRKYLSMLKERSLDPLTIKRNQKIHQLSQYLGTQICEIQDKLDNDWQEFMQQIKNSNKKLLQLPSNEAIIKTVVNNLNIIHNQKEYLESLAEILNKRRAISFGGRGIGYRNLKFESFENELGKLADTLLQSKLSSGEEDALCVTPQRKTLSPEKQSALREVLANRRITPVRPSKIYTPSQSRLCSTLALLSEAGDTQTTLTNKENESPEADRKFPEFTSNPMKTVSAFTANVSPAFKGSITYGLPASFPSNRPSTTTVTTTQVFTPSSTFTFKAVSSKDIEQPSIFSKSVSHSAFKNIAPVTTNKPSFDSPKVSMPSATGPSSFSFNQNWMLQKVPPSLGFAHVSRSPEQSPAQKPTFESANSFSLTRKKDSINVENSKPVNLFSPSVAAGDAKPIFFSMQNRESSNLYEDISPPDTPHHSDEEQESEFDSQFVTEGDVAKKLQDAPYSVIEVKSAERVQKSSTPDKVTLSVIAANVTSSAALHSNSFNTMGLPTSSPKAEVSSSFPAAVTNVQQEGNSVSVPIGNATSPISPVTVQSDGSSVVKKLFPTTFFGHPTSVASSLPEPTAASMQPALPNIIKPLFSTNFFGHPSSVTSSSSEPVITSTSTLPAKGLQPVAPVFGMDNSKSQLNTTVTGSRTESSSTSNKGETAASLSQSNAAPTAFKLSVPLGSSVSLNAPQSIMASASSPGVTVSDSQTAKPPDAVQVEAVDCSVSVRPPIIPHSVSEKTTVTAIISSSEPSSTVVNAISVSPSSVALPSETSVTTTLAVSTTPPATSVQPSVASVQPQELFGKSNTPSLPIFGQPTSVGSSSFFGQSSPAASTFAQASAATTVTAATTITTTTTTSQSLFGQTTVVTTASMFGQNDTTAVATTSTTGFFGQSPITTSTTTSSFFGQQSSGQSSFFGKASATAPVFGQTAPVQNSVFGQSVNSTPPTPFGQPTSGSFFSQPAASGTSVFGQKAQSPASPPVFGLSTASSFSFAKASSFGPQSSGSFGLAKSVFGQSSPSFGQQPAASSPFGQSPPAASGGMFGQNSFFSGLGGKPSEENASKNVFGSVAACPVTNNSIFGNQGASGFGSKLGTFGAGSFSSGGGSVAQSGFGAFQQTPQKTGGFGAPAAFGSSPSFGGSPTFGTSPTFGSGLPTPGSPLTGSSSFGTSPATGFGNFAATNAPSFGSLASQTGGFGSNQQQAAPTFGSLQQPQSGSTFGSSVFGSSPSFGAQSTGFGSPSGKEASAFTQWRH